MILYHSQEYNNTEAMAKAIEQGARKTGAMLALVNTKKKTNRYRRENIMR
ncbi:MAG: hypothetical protein JXA54_15700 [Candidatus Heimdallarchaeota archaeon]|nr:hypothetical protein [Candidatus Heimdallarchaeota archaeon]